MSRPPANRPEKLVRDRIPDLIRADGKACQIEQLSEADYRQALGEKLVEEAREVVEALKVDDASQDGASQDGASQDGAMGDDEELVRELADLWEVFEALRSATGVEWERLRQVKQQRRRDRGGFEERLKLLWVGESETGDRAE